MFVAGLVCCLSKVRKKLTPLPLPRESIEGMKILNLRCVSCFYKRKVRPIWMIRLCLFLIFLFCFHRTWNIWQNHFGSAKEAVKCMLKTLLYKIDQVREGIQKMFVRRGVLCTSCLYLESRFRKLSNQGKFYFIFANRSLHIRFKVLKKAFTKSVSILKSLFPVKNTLKNHNGKPSFVNLFIKGS